MHCENCGQKNPQTVDGYTACCNELVCDGNYKEKFIHDESGESIRACCWAKAAMLWKKEYGHYPPDGSYRV